MSVVARGKGKKLIYFDVRVDGVRHHFNAKEFYLPRLKPGQPPPKNRREVERDWLGELYAAIKRGEDPRKPPPKTNGESNLTIGEFIDTVYIPTYVEVERLKRPDTHRSNLRVLTPIIGAMPLKALEGTAVCDAVKAAYPVGEGQYALGTRNKLLRRVGHITTFALCRAFITKSPFHRGGVTVKQKGENRRTRRIYEEEEKRLLGAARTYEMTGTGNRVLTPDTVAEIRSRAAAGDRQIDIAADFRISSGLCNQIVRNIIWNPEKWKARETTGQELHDQIIGALDTGCRQEEMERIQNDYVDWTLHEIRMPARTNKSDIARNIPFDPKGRLAAILQKRRFIGGPKGYVFGNATGGSKPISRKVWENVGTPRARPRRGAPPTTKRRVVRDQQCRLRRGRPALA